MADAPQLEFTEAQQVVATELSKLALVAIAEAQAGGHAAAVITLVQTPHGRVPRILWSADVTFAEALQYLDSLIAATKSSPEAAKVSPLGSAFVMGPRRA